MSGKVGFTKALSLLRSRESQAAQELGWITDVRRAGGDRASL
ncbi:MAG TPA: hypothetical protein VEH28_08050 [Thermoplasmata archaeon]|nr:hypothetical protein [Thermoplasmata archaeon]